MLHTLQKDTQEVYLFTVTCYKWLPLFEEANAYVSVYKWLDHLKDDAACYFDT